jgi:hypothetical protein
MKISTSWNIGLCSTLEVNRPFEEYVASIFRFLETKFSSETSVDSEEIIRHYMAEDIILKAIYVYGGIQCIAFGYSKSIIEVQN